jgi:glycosyltransferase involved in cell wall biosynthesis
MPTQLSQSSKTRAPRTAILHLSPELEPGDPGRETVDLAVLTQRAGWRALIASAGGSLVQEAERAAVRHRSIIFNGQGFFGAWRSRLQLERLILKERPALLHAHGIETLALACILGRNRRLPVVADITQPVADTARHRRIMANLKSAQGIVRVPSEFMRRQMVDILKLEPERLMLIPPGVDLQWHSAGFVSPERLQSLSQNLRLPEQAAVVLVPLPLNPDMGHKPFLAAMARLKDENIYAILAGSDRHAPGLRVEIENLVSELGLNGKVIMPESCADLPAACWLSSVVAAPNSAPRGQNLELLAAQAIGRAVIVTNTGANPEMVRSGETAWVVPPDNIKALTDAMSEAIHLDTDQRLDLAARTHDFVAETFPQGAWFDGMMRLYESLLQPAERSARRAA